VASGMRILAASAPRRVVRQPRVWHQASGVLPLFLTHSHYGSMMLIDSIHNVQLHWFNMLERSSSPFQWQQHARAELLSASVSSPIQWQQHDRAELHSASVVNFAMYAPQYTGPVPPNPMTSASASSSGPPDVACQWAGWDSGDEEMEVDDTVVHEPSEGAPRRPRAVGPGGRRCIVAATCSSGAHLRFSGSNILERRYSPLARAELLSASAVVNLTESECQQPCRSVE
jgi:hypothetical protein